MALDDWRHGTRPESVANRLEADASSAGAVGTHHYKFMATVTVLLDAWSVGNRAEAGLDAIPFDKLANVAARTWSRARDLSTEVTAFSPVPFVEIRGVHGPGYALIRHKGRPPRYVVEVLHDLQQLLPQRALLEVRATHRNKHGELVPNHPTTTVHLPLPRRDCGGLLSDLGVHGGSLMEALSEPFGQLDENEVRALGTHKDAEALLSSLDYHWSRLRDGRVIVIDQLRAQATSPPEALRDMEISCDELRRKAFDNEGRYAKARETIIASLPQPSLARSSFEAVHRPAAEVWCPEGLGGSKGRIPEVCALVRILRLVFNLRGPQQVVDPDVADDLYHELLDDIPDHGLPRAVDGLADRSEDGAAAVIDRLEVLAQRVGI